ncbi:hypothetical protein ABW19_dt0200880 [Dactylella cylindrospora]|nr:hypothetical protein ABW19_dt0200880 [Dactylella cylindrospora]
MTAAIADTNSPLAPPLRKQPVMEDRKRPLNDANPDDTPPSKRQAMTTSDEPQTQEDVVVLDEVRLLADSDLPDKTPQQNGDSHDRVPKALFYADDETFKQHLEAKQEAIVQTLSALFKKVDGRSDTTTDKVPKLQKRISELLAAEKSHRVELERVTQEKDDAEQQLTMAAIRYLQAEKRLDRLKSQTVAKIEQQANNSSANENSKPDASSSKAKFTDGQLADAELARKEAEAIASRQEKEIKQLQAENSRLQEQCTNYNLKLGRLSEEDIVNCDTYKNVRLRLEDVVARVNHLEALNSTLSKENENLQAERTSFRKTITDEQSLALGEANTHVAKCEADLARIRAYRDQLVAEIHTLKAAAEKVVSTDRSELLKKLVESQQEKIASLEGEVQRLRLEAGQEPVPDSEEIANLSPEELMDGMKKLHASHKILETEFKAIESAWKKAHDVSKVKFDELVTLNQTIIKLKQEKIAYDRKLFDAGKMKDSAVDKARAFQAQHDRSSEIIMNLKNAEKKQAALMANLEKQVAELKVSNERAVLAQKNLQTQLAEAKNQSDSLQRQNTSMRGNLKEVEERNANENNRRRAAENELEKTLVRLSTLEQSVKALSRVDNEDSTLDTLRSMVRCNVCRVGMKARAIKQCGHLFCKDCVEERIISRNRKCPNCSRPFAATDIISIVL